MFGRAGGVGGAGAGAGAGAGTAMAQIGTIATIPMTTAAHIARVAIMQMT